MTSSTDPTAGRPPLDPEALREQVAHIIDAQMSAWNGWRISDAEFLAEARKAAAEVHDLYAAALREREEALLDVDRFSNPLAPYWWRKKYDRLMRTIRANTPTPEVPHAD
jgi:hypothetical protein